MPLGTASSSYYPSESFPACVQSVRRRVLIIHATTFANPLNG
jgi:hypothetical protein